jgi:3-oxosteroid 1-dehydrogenase
MVDQRAADAVTVVDGELAWDQTADVVIVGTGIAACSTAYNVLEQGVSVLMLEKGETTGGTSAKAAAGMMVPNNRFLQELGNDDPREDFIRFMARIGRPLLYDAGGDFFGLPEWEYRLIETWYDNAAEAFAHMQDTGAMRLAHQPDWSSYNDLPEDKRRFGRVIFNVDDDGELINGRSTIDRLLDKIGELGGRVLTDHRVDGVFINGEREVVGVRVSHGAESVLVRANRAVVFASGGFTHSERYTREYLNGMYVGGCAARTNEGDLIPIAKALGVPLFHMHSAWGSPLVYEQALDRDPALIANFSLMGDSSFSVNKYGFRVTNEKTTYNDRTQSHFRWDPTRAEYPNFLQFAILDERTRRLWPRQGMADHQAGNFIPPIGEESPYLMRADTFEELAVQIDRRLQQLEATSGGVRLSSDFAANLQATVERFNGYARDGADDEFHRGETAIELFMHGDRGEGNDLPNPTMFPLADSGPYYATILAPGSIETKGGPKVNPSLQILDGTDTPIAGLYGVGNCVASPSGQAYWSGGSTWGPYVTYGYVAARHIVQEPVRLLGAGASV